MLLLFDVLLLLFDVLLLLFEMLLFEMLKVLEPKVHVLVDLFNSPISIHRYQFTDTSNQTQTMNKAKQQQHTHSSQHIILQSYSASSFNDINNQFNRNHNRNLVKFNLKEQHRHYTTNKMSTTQTLVSVVLAGTAFYLTRKYNQITRQFESKQLDAEIGFTREEMNKEDLRGKLEEYSKHIFVGMGIGTASEWFVVLHVVLCVCFVRS